MSEQENKVGQMTFDFGADFAEKVPSVPENSVEEEWDAVEEGELDFSGDPELDTCGNPNVNEVTFFAERVQGRWPCCRGYGGRTGPCFTVPNQHAERNLKKQSSTSQDGCRGNPPAEEPPAPSFRSQNAQT